MTAYIAYNPATMKDVKIKWKCGNSKCNHEFYDKVSQKVDWAWCPWCNASSTPVGDLIAEDKNREKKTICVDFDGTIYDYKEGWQGGIIRGNVTPGFFEWYAEASKYFKIVVYSTRSSVEKFRDEMMNWLTHKANEHGIGLGDIEFSDVKPKAFLTIDDRCVRFDGNWRDSNLNPQNLLAYKPWNHK